MGAPKAAGAVVPDLPPWPKTEIVAATAADLPAIRHLVAAAGLPADDLGAPHQAFVVARSRGEVVGCAAIERYGNAALLRSMAVAPSRRGEGLGIALRERLLTDAADLGIAELYLLTTTAEAFFARAGFVRIARDEVPAAVRASAEFRSLCPATAACMARSVSRRGPGPRARRVHDP